MPYEVLQDDVSVLKSRGKLGNAGGEIEDHVAITYQKGAIIADDDISPVVVAAYDDKDEHVLSVLRRVSKSKSKAEESADE